MIATLARKATFLTIFAIIGTSATLFFGFLYFSERLFRRWSILRQGIVAFLATLIVLGLSAWVGRGKFLVEKQDLLRLREIAARAYDRGEYDATVRLITWALKFQSDDEEFYRIRARAYKRLGPDYYRSEIEDRKIVFRLNPARELNHLPLIEDYVLLNDCKSASTWIRGHESALRDSDVRIMFRFFDIVCQILEGREYSGAVARFRAELVGHPLSKHFATRFWEWGDIIAFVGRSPIPESARAAIKDLVQVMRDTAK